MTHELVFQALEAIPRHEELSFHYATTEWEMAEAFACQCTSKKCRSSTTQSAFQKGNLIQGAKFLTHPQQAQLLPLFTPFVTKKLLEQALQNQ